MSIWHVIAEQFRTSWTNDPQFLLRGPGGGIPADLGMILRLDSEQMWHEHVLYPGGCPPEYLEPISPRLIFAAETPIQPFLNVRRWRPTSCHSYLGIEAHLAPHITPSRPGTLRIVGCLYEEGS